MGFHIGPTSTANCNCKPQNSCLTSGFAVDVGPNLQSTSKKLQLQSAVDVDVTSMKTPYVVCAQMSCCEEEDVDANPQGRA